MTTPICNCPEDIGWLPESSWPYSAASKTNAQPIYCIDGSPVVPPRAGGKALSWGEARLDLDTALTAFPAGDDSIAGLGGVVQNVTISNPYPYPIQLMALVTTSWRIALNSGVVMMQTTTIRVSGSDYASAYQYEYPQLDGTVSPHGKSLALRHSKNHFQIGLAQIAAGSSVAVGMRHSYEWVAGTGSPTAADQYGPFSGVIRFVGGTI